MEMMIRNVIFDVGNVLIEFDWQKFLRNLFDEETAKAVSPAMWGTAAWDEMDRGVDCHKLFFYKFLKKIVYH